MCHVLEAVKECRTVNELGTGRGVHPTQISQWKRQLLEGLPELFSSRRRKRARGRGSPADGTVPGGRPPGDRAGVVKKSCPIQPWQRARCLSVGIPSPA
jgi:hypothetical protein